MPGRICMSSKNFSEMRVPSSLRTLILMRNSGKQEAVGSEVGVQYNRE
jgi:hypothetical protein